MMTTAQPTAPTAPAPAPGTPGTPATPGSTPGIPGDPAAAGPKKPTYLKTGAGDKPYVDYRAIEDLRRLMTPNGKIYSRKRLGVSAREQRMIAQAIKRARYMGLLPYTNATL